ncbi:MAG: hypothetical protein HRT71_09975 [Flavobacteriales bacterium]|nr:hypothetical protein [Flavobacteriales bacterium]
MTLDLDSKYKDYHDKQSREIIAKKEKLSKEHSNLNPTPLLDKIIKELYSDRSKPYLSLNNSLTTLKESLISDFKNELIGLFKTIHEINQTYKEIPIKYFVKNHAQPLLQEYRGNGLEKDELSNWSDSDTVRHVAQVTVYRESIKELLHDKPKVTYKHYQTNSKSTNATSQSRASINNQGLQLNYETKSSASQSRTS